MKHLFLYIIVLTAIPGFSQQEDPQAKEKALTASNDFTYDANSALAKDDFVEAEADYRKAISKSGENTAAKYNMGNAYYKNNSLDEAFVRYKQAGDIARTKAEKHKTYHNMGNVFMKNKAYEKAVEAYKEALRNDPDDEETRYNLALAKEMLKKQQENQKNDQNKDQQNNEDNKDKEQNKDDKGEEKDKNEENGEKKDGDDKKQDENKEGENNKEQEKKDQDKKGEQPEDKQDKPSPPRPNQLSPQQIKNILEAMSNEEKKVQDKVNAKKVKGVPVKSEKDW